MDTPQIQTLHLNGTLFPLEHCGQATVPVREREAVVGQFCPRCNSAWLDERGTEIVQTCPVSAVAFEIERWLPCLIPE